MASYTEVKGLDGVVYKLSALTIKQVRQKAELEIQEEKDQKPGRGFAANVRTITMCLQNAEPGNGWSEDKVGDIIFPVYQQLLEAALEVSGFVPKGDKGEIRAT